MFAKNSINIYNPSKNIKSLWRLVNIHMKKYYIYGLYDKDENCFYIGKGTGKRLYDHRKNFKKEKASNHFLYCKLKSFKTKKKNFFERIIVDNLNEEDALLLEKEYIKKYKRKIDGGILCNFLEGGNQPPSIKKIKEMYGEIKYKKQIEKFKKSLNKKYYEKNLKYVPIIKKYLENRELIKDIAKKLNIHRDTISRWIKIYNLKYDNSKKKILERERLKSFRESNSKKIQKTSKIYLILTPSGEKIKTEKLVVFCKERNVDYRSLRNTFNKFKINGTQCKSKGYCIIKQEERNLPILTT